jgi:hypothetical protein
MIYMETIGALQFEDPSSVGELMMVGRDVDGRHQDVYISVPSRELLARFDGFEAVSETELPKQIDFIHIAELENLVRDDLNWRCSMSDDSKLVDPMTFDRPARFS